MDSYLMWLTDIHGEHEWRYSCGYGYYVFADGYEIRTDEVLKLSAEFDEAEKEDVAYMTDDSVIEAIHGGSSTMTKIVLMVRDGDASSWARTLRDIHAL